MIKPNSMHNVLAPIANAMPWEHLFGLISSLLREKDPEEAREIVISLMEKGYGRRSITSLPKGREVDLWGLKFPNPVGLAAGFDKDARALETLSTQGFGFLEVGTVTPLAQLGNHKPRMFRIDDDEAVINQFGFNNDGIDEFCDKLAAFAQSKDRTRIVLAANIGKNKDTRDAYGDYAICAGRVAPFVDMVTINISSPNTPNLRDLHSVEHIHRLIQVTREGVAKNSSKSTIPFVLKVSPDLNEEQIKALCDACEQEGVDGLNVGNTTTQRPENMPDVFKNLQGGLSGKPLFDYSNYALEKFSSHLQGRIPIIGCGGVSSAADALVKVQLGASLVQLYTSWSYKGPKLVDHIVRALSDEKLEFNKKTHPIEYTHSNSSLQAAQ